MSSLPFSACCFVEAYSCACVCVSVSVPVSVSVCVRAPPLPFLCFAATNGGHCEDNWIFSFDLV
jgi:hypothetical protein